MNLHIALQLRREFEVIVVGPVGSAMRLPTAMIVCEVPHRPLWRFLSMALMRAVRLASMPWTETSTGLRTGGQRFDGSDSVCWRAPVRRTYRCLCAWSRFGRASPRLPMVLASLPAPNGFVYRQQHPYRSFGQKYRNSGRNYLRPQSRCRVARPGRPVFSRGISSASWAGIAQGIAFGRSVDAAQGVAGVR